MPLRRFTSIATLQQQPLVDLSDALKVSNSVLIMYLLTLNYIRRYCRRLSEACTSNQVNKLPCNGTVSLSKDRTAANLP